MQPFTENRIQFANVARGKVAIYAVHGRLIRVGTIGKKYVTFKYSGEKKAYSNYTEAKLYARKIVEQHWEQWFGGDV